jgi:hypothetical protein
LGVGMVKELEEDFVEEIKQKYVGKWVGLKGRDVVVVSDSHDEVFRELKDKKMDGVYVFYSPTEREKQYGFLFG